MWQQGEDEDQDEARLPTALWVEAECAKLNARGQGYYISRRGDPSTGTVLVKLYDIHQRVCMLYQQQRDLTGKLGWIKALGETPLSESEVDAAIQSQSDFDPDLWVIEIEAPNLDNPFSI